MGISPLGPCYIGQIQDSKTLTLFVGVYLVLGFCNRIYLHNIIIQLGCGMLAKTADEMLLLPVYCLKRLI